MNALTDEAIIEELYAASQEGAQIDVVARGICSLRPGVDGMSETIRVRTSSGASSSTAGSSISRPASGRRT